MPANPRPTSKKYVLIVDDHHPTLEAMGAALEREFSIFLAPDLSIADSVLDCETVEPIKTIPVAMGWPIRYFFIGSESFYLTMKSRK